MRVSIVVPTYKRAHLLSRLLESVCTQTFKEFEVIIVDDCTPNQGAYEDVLRAFSGRIPSLQFVRNEQNRGACFSRNRGVRLSQYDFVALVDDDDEWLPRKLELQVECMKSSPANVGLVYTWTDEVSEGLRRPIYRSTTSGACLKQIVESCFIPSPSVMVRRHALLKAGLFDEMLPSCQDWDMWTRMIKQGFEVRVVPETLALYHRQASDSVGTSPRARRGYVLYYQKHFGTLVRFGQWRHIVRMLRFAIGA